MHAGVLPGYPASHGCIRMPMAFAIKMWNWTRMGARVVVTPGELTPTTFAHTLLPTQKVAPQPVAAVEPNAGKPGGAAAAKAALEAKVTSPGSANPESTNTMSASPAAADAGTDLPLRTSVGHDESVKTGMATPLRAQTRTADASGDAKPLRVTMSDASPGGSMPQHEDGAATSESTLAASTDSKLSASAPPDIVAGPRPAETGAKSMDTKSQDTAPQDPRLQDPGVSTKVGARPDEKPIDAKIDSRAETRIDAAKPDAAAIEPAKAADGAVDAAKDKAAAAKTDRPRRAGQIAVFISRKDSRLYVRQNFAPLFEAAVTIAPSDRPLGTHVFTADLDRKDTNTLHWSVVTLPVSMRSATRAADEEHGARLRRSSAAIEARPAPLPDTPAEALDRIDIPADAMTRVSDALTSGGSIIVSDQGINQGETGEGTDFIVSLR